MIRVYACGGAGTNIGKQIKDLDLDIGYIDTSLSNLKGISPDDYFVTPTTDGSGKDRGVSYEAFQPYMEDILIRLKPSSQLNIVISAVSGGSGSVIGPLVTSELIKKNYPTVVIAIDSKNSHKELDNTVKTLKSYQSISTTNKKSIALYYIENHTRKEADVEAIRFVNLLSLITDKPKTDEFDSADLYNFINFDKVTDNKPTVGVIELTTNESFIPERNTSIAASILVVKDRHVNISEPIPEYAATCVIIDPNYNQGALRVNNILGQLFTIITNLEKTNQTFQENKRLAKPQEVDVTATNNTGIIL